MPDQGSASHLGDQDKVGWRRYITVALLAGVVALLAGLAPLYLSVRDFRLDMISDLTTRARILSHGKVDTLSTWINAKTDLGRQLSENPLVQLLASDYAQASAGGGRVSAEVSSQLPYINRAFDRFTVQNGLTGAYLLGTDGEAIAAAVDSPPLPEELRDEVRGTSGLNELRVLRFRQASGLVVLDFLTPVFGPQSVGSAAEKTVMALLVVSVPASGIVSEILSNHPFENRMERTFILQPGTSTPEPGQTTVRPDGVEPVDNIRIGTELGGENLLSAFSIGSPEAVYSYMVVSEEFNWQIIFEVNRQVIDGPFNRYLSVGLLMVLLFALLVSSLMLGIGWRQRVRSIAEAADEFRRMQAFKDRMINNSLRILVHAVERHTKHLAGHSVNLARLTKGVAAELGLPVSEQNALEQASLLSQICKADMPKEISESQERLDEAQRQAIREGIAQSLSDVSALELDDVVRRSIKQMFERLDGSGFPNGLRGDQIPLISRILSTGDIFVARLSPRAYRDPISAVECMEVLRGNPDKYDQSVVDALSRFITGGEGQVILSDIASAGE